ncbi:MAG TPA: hypothetical protein VN026_18740 [Bacteroidia bacterium]|jgi:hypothetical protein|nr:hypothetical protein [Bacteroidia bacterium]
MNEQQEKAYFDAESLKKLIAAEGRTVKTINCYLWQNSINKNDVVELIDVFEIVFTDGYKLSLCSNSDNIGMDAIDYNYEAERKEIEKEHGGKIKVYGVTASGTKMWTDVIGLKLQSIQLTKEDLPAGQAGKNYLSDSVVFNFGEEKRVVSISPLDGLIIDFYEED